MLSELFDQSDFPARWHCGLWTNLHGWVHICADTAIFGAYAAIPATILYFLLRKRDVQLPTLWWLFAAFIASCGFGHLVEATIFWHPWYRFAALVKVVTAVVSWATVLALYRHIPSLLNLPGIHNLNSQLRNEVEQRKKTEAERERFFDLSLDMLCMANFDGYFVRLNPAFEATLGYSREELLATPFLDLVHPEDVERTRLEMQRLQRGEVSLELENRYRAKDGSWRWLAWKAAPDTVAKLIYATARDVTEYRRVERSLRLREQDAQLQIAVGACLLKSESLEQSLQHSCEAIGDHLKVSLVRVWTKKSASELLELKGSVGREPSSGELEKDLSFGQTAIGRIVENRWPVTTNELNGLELGAAAPEGTVAFAGYPLVAGSEVTGVLAIFSQHALSEEEFRTLESISQDVSAAIVRSLTQEALRKSEADARRLALVAARTDNAVVITDRDGLVEWVNEGFVRITGYTLEEVRGRKPGHVLRGPKTDPAATEAMRSAIRLGVPFLTEVINYRKDGTEFCVTIEGQPLFDEEGQLTSFMAVETDITLRKIAEEKLRASEEYNRRIVESTTDQLEVLHLHDCVVESSDHRLHLPAPANAPQGWLDGWHEDDRQEAERALQEAGEGEARRFQGRKISGNQMVGVWDVALSPIRNAYGRPERLLAVSRDITQQRANEEALRDLNATLEARVEKRAAELAESQARFQSAMHNSAVGMGLVRMDGIWLDVNQALCRTVGHSSEDLLTTDCRAVMHPDDLQPDLVQARRLMSGEIPSYQMEKRYLHRDGSIIWGHQSVSLSRDRNGEPLHFILQVQDITERKRAELELIQSEERFRLMVEHVQDYAIFMLDPDGRIVSWNQGAERTMGYPAAEVLQKHFSVFHGSSSDGFAAAEALLAEAGQVGHVKDEGPRQRQDGRTIWVEVMLTAIKDPAGALRGYACVTHDLTKRRETESKFLRSQRLEAIGNLASGVAHDLNNALGPIMLGLDVLRQSYPKEDAIIDAFETCGRRASDMVRQLLTFARGAEGERATVKCTYLLKELQKIMMGTLPKNIHTVWECPMDLRAIHGDPTQIHQVLLNLCVNARDAMPNGGTLTVEAKNVEVDEVFASSQEGAKPGSYVRVDVRDTGEGIPPHILDRIFEPFFTTKSPDKGTGLGLATVMGIVRGHGGFLRVYSTPGDGSMFSIFLPVSTIEVALEVAKDDENDFTGQGEKILVVDDEPTIREVSRRVLERLNFTVVTATDGADALIQIAECRNELKAVVTDMHMPHMDGIGLVRAIRRVLPDLPVIMASGRLEESEKKELAKLRVAGLLHKPFTQDEFAAVLKEVLAPEIL